MKMKWQNGMVSKLALGMVALLGAAAPPSRGAAVDVARIEGMVRFNNENGTIKSFLHDNLTHPLAVNWRSTHAVARSGGTCSETSDGTPGTDVAGHELFTYQLDVSVPPGGSVYDVGGGVCGARWNFLPEAASPLILAPGSVTIVNVEGCIGLAQVRFVDPLGTASAVRGARYSITSAGRPLGNGFFPDSTEGFFLPLPTGVPVDILLLYETGSDWTTDTAYFSANLPLTAACDVVTDVPVTVAPPTARGRIEGRLDMADFGAVVNREQFHDDPTYLWSSVMMAFRPPRDGALEPGRIDRVTRLPDGPDGSSGPFTLPNLPEGVYSVYGRMTFGSGRTFNFFQTPVLRNVPVAIGQGNNLSDTFVIHPGKITGRIELRSPSAGLQNLRLDADENALVERFTTVTAHGSPNTGFPRLGGLVTGRMAGSFPAPGHFLGDYVLMAGGLNGTPSQWDVDEMTLRFNGSAGGSYVKGIFRVTRQEHDLFDLVPDQAVTRDIRLCLSEVKVRFISDTARLFNPRVDLRGAYDGPNRPWDGENIRYSVATIPESGAFEGLPSVVGGATNAAEVTLYIPSGTYSLTPRVKTVDAAGNVSELQLPAIPLNNIGPCDIICVSSCLQPQIANSPACAGVEGGRVEGYIATPCTNPVVRLEWSVPSGVTNILCENCGLDPSFSFVLPVNSPCSDQTFTLTAYDNVGGAACVTRTIPRDSTLPTIQCPTNLVVQCAGPNGITVAYPASATDNCDPNPILVCTPPSGSFFSPGQTVVRCAAYDRCQNEATCEFTVTVLSDCPDLCRDLEPVTSGSYSFLGEHPAAPGGATTDWSEEAQGLAHDRDHWFMVQRRAIWRVPVGTDLQAVTASSPGVIRKQLGSAGAGGLPELTLAGYDHLGDPEHFEWAGHSYLFVPIEDGAPSGLTVFRGTDLSYITHKPLTGHGHAAWCAFEPNGRLLTAKEFDLVTSIQRFQINWATLRDSGVLNLTPEADFILRDEAGNFLTLERLQGGVVSPRGDLLYLVAEGIHVFDLATGRRVARSNNGLPGSFNFQFLPGGGEGEEPEGITYWDLDDGRSPGIRGQLHAILLDNDLSSDDDIYLKHYAERRVFSPECLSMTCPTNLVVNCAGSVNYEVRASSPCAFLPTVNCVPPSGSLFNSGTTIVRCVGRDECGNSNSCSFTVTVLNDCSPNGCSGANLLVNGSFEEPGIPDFYWQTGPADPLITGWRTLGNGVEYHDRLAPGTIYPVASDAIANGLYAIDLASANGPGGIQQTFPTMVGRTYTVSFYLGTVKERGRDGYASVHAKAADEERDFEMFNDGTRTFFTRHTFSFEAKESLTTLSLTTTNQPDRAFVEVDDVWVGECCLELFCPLAQTVSCQDAAGVVVNYSFFAVDHCALADPVTWCDPPSGSLFPIGVSTVNCHAVGSGQTNRCSFTVTVLNDCPTNCLTIACPTNVTVNCLGTNGTPVFYNVSATNHCGAHEVSVSCVPPSGSVFPLGTTVVTCTANSSNETRQCSFTVSVVPQLRMRRTVTIEWDCGVLQSAPTVTGPYTDVVGATSPFAADVESKFRFFRTR